MIMTEDYVSFEVAKLLKEKGFDEPCRVFYKDPQAGLYEFKNAPKAYKDKLFEPCFLAPSLYMAMKWLREVHNINIDIVPIWNRNRWEYQIFIVTPATSQRPYVANTLYLDYEEAVEEALKYSLENLI